MRKKSTCKAISSQQVAQLLETRRVSEELAAIHSSIRLYCPPVPSATKSRSDGI